MKVAALALFASICEWISASGAVTLYRDTIIDQSVRIHVATFDAREGLAYNSENCAQAAKLFAGQDGASVRFWCEPGLYHD